MAISRRTLLVVLGALVTVFFFFSASQTTAIRATSADIVKAKLTSWQPHLFEDTEEREDALEFDSNGRPILNIAVGALPSAEAPPSPPSVPSIEQHDNAWRLHLESEHSPYDQSFLSDTSLTTLGFSRIYVVSAAGEETPRRARMSKLGRALGIELTFVDALTEDNSIVLWIAERVKEVRELKRKLLAKELDIAPSEVGGLAPGSMWLQPSVEMPKVKHHQYSVSSVFTEANAIKPAYGSIKFPDMRTEDERWGGQDWVTFLENSPDFEMDPNDSQLNVAQELRDDQEAREDLQLTSKSLAQWYNHLQVYTLMEKNGEASALVLEDEVDAEWDIARIWSSLERHLPKKNAKNLSPWDITYLGHCGESEQAHPVYLHPLLHRAADPRCLYGYAVSKVGYTKLLELLSDPWAAYQTHLDVALASYALSDAINSFSIDPPIITHLPQTFLDSEDLETDEVPQLSLLGDSTMERIWKDEGKTISQAELLPPDRKDASGFRLKSAKKPKKPVADQ